MEFVCINILCKSCKVAVNDHQINHKSSYSLLTITRARAAVALHARSRVYCDTEELHTRVMFCHTLEL